jgi:hypothetical protein
MTTWIVRCALLTAIVAFTAQANPLIGGPKTIAVGADGTVPGLVAAPQMGQGSYVSGATKVAVPLIAVAFETSAEASTSNSFVSKSLSLRLSVDDDVMKAVAAELQAMVEADLVAQGFEILPKDSIDADPRWQGIKKSGQVGVDVKDNFMSGFMGNGSMNRWYTAGDRPLFGTGFTGALSDLSPLIRTARDKKISLLFYRFKVQFTDLEGKNGLVFNYIKGKNVLRIVSADLAVFTPEHTNAALIKLNANVTAGSDFVQEMQGVKGSYVVVADPVAYKADALTLIHAVSMQLAQALKKGQ